MSTPNHVLFLLFPGFNILDATGPLEVLANRHIVSTNKFTTTIAAANETTTSFEKCSVKRDISFDELLKDGKDGKPKLFDYDILVMPGGPPNNVQAAIDSEDHRLLDMIQSFARNEIQNPADKWLISICTGAGFLATRGLFAGKTVTAHWSYLDRVREICDAQVAKDGSEPTTVVRKRWVDAGLLPSGVRLATAGGVSCGIDCTMWLVSEIVGMEAAKNVAKAMDYDWKYGGMSVTEGQIV